MILAVVGDEWSEAGCARTDEDRVKIGRLGLHNV